MLPVQTQGEAWFSKINRPHVLRGVCHCHQGASTGCLPAQLAEGCSDCQQAACSGRHDFNLLERHKSSQESWPALLLRSQLCTTQGMHLLIKIMSEFAESPARASFPDFFLYLPTADWKLRFPTCQALAQGPAIAWRQEISELGVFFDLGSMGGQTWHAKWPVLVFIWLLAALGLCFQDRHSRPQWSEESHMVEHLSSCVFCKGQHDTQLWPEITKHITLLDGKRHYSNTWVTHRQSSRDKCRTCTLPPAMKYLFHFSKLLGINSTDADFSLLSHLVLEHACASLLASFRESIAHNFKSARWNNANYYNVKQCVCMLFHGRSTGTVSLPPCPPTSLFKWRSCSFCTGPHPSAVSNLKGTDLERWSRARELIIKLVIANKYYKK